MAGTQDQPRGNLELEAELRALRREVDALPDLWERQRKIAEEAKKDADKAYRKAAQAKRAAERAGGFDEDEDEDGQTHLSLHDGARQTGGMHSVHGDVAGDPPSDLARRALAAGWTPYL